MMELLHYGQEHKVDFCLIRLAFENTMPGSQLRKLMAEELAAHRREMQWNNGYRRLDFFDSTPGALAEFAEAIDRYYDGSSTGWGWGDRTSFKDDRVLSKWRQYMVGECSKQPPREETPKDEPPFSESHCMETAFMFAPDNYTSVSPRTGLLRKLLDKSSAKVEWFGQMVIKKIRKKTSLRDDTSSRASLPSW
jgi:hypothetical protein